MEPDSRLDLSLVRMCEIPEFVLRRKRVAMAEVIERTGSFLLQLRIGLWGLSLMSHLAFVMS